MALPGDQKDTLADRFNHFFIHPRIFTKASGPRTIKAKALAYAILKQLNLQLADLATEQEKLEVCEEMANLKVLLAFLWVSQQGFLTAVTRSGMEESPHLNHQRELILKTNRKPATPQAGSSLDPARGSAMATQSLMLSMQQT